MKYLTYFKKTVLLCVKYGWLKSDPFAGYNLNRKEVEKPYLTEDELERVATKVLPRQGSVMFVIFLYSAAIQVWLILMLNNLSGQN